MLKLLVFTVFPVIALGAVVNSPTEAANLVMETMVTDLSNKEVRSFDGLVSEGEVLGSWGYPAEISPFDGYLVLVDDYAFANWTHPCRWVFVSPQGELNAVRKFSPPDLLPRMSVEYTCLPEYDAKGQYEDFIAWFTPNVQSSAGQADHMYAWIISGGYDSSNNHIRYYGDVQFIYNVLAHDYLIPDDHIIVCFADGTNPAPDQSGGINSNPDFDDDGDTDITYDATSAGVTSGYNAIDALVGSDDHLFIYTTDHGGPAKNGDFDNPPEVILNLWGGTLDDDVFEGYLDNFSAVSIHVIMEQCYSGGFLGEVIKAGVAQPRTFASAANGSESSWAGATYPEYDEYAYYWTGSMHGTVPAAGSMPAGALPGEPDMNSDGCISMYEAAYRAEEWDTYAQSGQEHPQWDDTPDSCGDTYFLGGLIGTAVENSAASVPSMGLSISMNPVVSTAIVSFTLPAAAQATVEIIDITGRVVATPVNGTVASGSHSVASGLSSVPAGIYVVRLTSEGNTETLRAVKL